jgi:hypothetical protein
MSCARSRRQIRSASGVSTTTESCSPSVATSRPDWATTTDRAVSRNRTGACFGSARTTLPCSSTTLESMPESSSPTAWKSPISVQPKLPGTVATSPASAARSITP